MSALALPLLVYGLAVAAVRAYRRDRLTTLRDDLLLAALALGISIGLGTELLGAFRAVSFPGVLGFWLAAAAAAAAALARGRRRSAPPPLRIPQLAAADAALLGGGILVALALLLVAALAPPQSSDSIGYHMSRVMHWIQNRSLAPYPTADSRQLFQPPFAEIVRLHLSLLTGSDRAGSLLQWFAAAGAFAAASLIARDLGGGRRAQILAAVLALTLPIGITQATSGKNGWVEALWLLALAHFSGAAAPRGLGSRGRGAIVAAFAALGLELMTKVTAWFFAFPIVALAILRTPLADVRRLWRPAALGSFLILALNFPYLERNLSVFRNPITDSDFRASQGLEHISPAIVASNVVRNLAFQLGTKSPAFNEELLRCVVRIHGMLGADPFDPRTSSGRFGIWPPSKVEEVAGSPLHILLLLGVGVALSISRRLRAGATRPALFVSIAAGFLLFCATIRYQPPNCRLLMPLLVLAAPLAAVVATDALGRAAPALGIVLIAAGLPFVVGTFGRHLSFEPGKGVLATSRIDLYFARVPELRESYEAAAWAVRTSGIGNLGVVYRESGQPEYLLWVLLRNARHPVRIEHVAVTSALATLASRPPFRDFRPELVVVFASSARQPAFPREVATAGTTYSFVRSTGLAGFYLPRRVESDFEPRMRVSCPFGTRAVPG